MPNYRISIKKGLIHIEYQNSYHSKLIYLKLTIIYYKTLTQLQNLKFQINFHMYFLHYISYIHNVNKLKHLLNIIKSYSVINLSFSQINILKMTSY